MAPKRSTTVEVEGNAECIHVRGRNRIPEVEVEIVLNRCSRTSDGKTDPNTPYTKFRPTFYRRRKIGMVGYFLLDPARYMVAAQQLLSSARLHSSSRHVLEERVAELIRHRVQGAAGRVGLKKVVVQIEAEVRITYWSDPSGLDERDETCAVCLEGFQEEKECIRIACSHKFHVDCARQWMENYTKTSPLCRYRIGQR